MSIDPSDSRRAFLLWIEALQHHVDEFLRRRRTNLDMLSEDILALVYRDPRLYSAMGRDVRQVLSHRDSMPGMTAFVAQLTEVCVATERRPQTPQCTPSALDGVWMCTDVVRVDESADGNCSPNHEGYHPPQRSVVNPSVMELVLAFCGFFAFEVAFDPQVRELLVSRVCVCVRIWVTTH